MRPARARVLVGVLCFLGAVDAVAIAAKGRLHSPLPLPWDAETDRRMPPLARFDAGWYLSVAEHGYPERLPEGETNAVFLPLFPLLMRAASAVFRVPLLWAGFAIAHACAIGAALLLARDAETSWPEASPGAAVARLLLWPFSFFLAAPYILTLLALALRGAKVRAPTALGQPFEQG